MEEPDNSDRGKIVALIVVVLIVLGGIFLEQKLRADANIQDCVMAGRTNCAPIAGSPG